MKIRFRNSVLWVLTLLLSMNLAWGIGGVARHFTLWRTETGARVKTPDYLEVDVTLNPRYEGNKYLVEEFEEKLEGEFNVDIEDDIKGQNFKDHPYAYALIAWDVSRITNLKEIRVYHYVSQYEIDDDDVYVKSKVVYYWKKVSGGPPLDKYYVPEFDIFPNEIDYYFIELVFSDDSTQKSRILRF